MYREFRIAGPAVVAGAGASVAVMANSREAFVDLDGYRRRIRIDADEPFLAAVGQLLEDLRRRVPAARAESVTDARTGRLLSVGLRAVSADPSEIDQLFRLADVVTVMAESVRRC